MGLNIADGLIVVPNVHVSGSDCSTHGSCLLRTSALPVALGLARKTLGLEYMYIHMHMYTYAYKYILCIYIYPYIHIYTHRGTR